ncbi:MAG: endonuclease/exonuclease/phosphatase family protein [Rudanella sp.]|nr:endonuclease/exonuclease/phosphatase family protein [Rudanella sp.]
MISRWFFPVATVGVIVAPLLGRWFGESFFLCELLSHFPVQYAGVAGLLVAFWLGKSRCGMASVALLGLLLNVSLCVGPFLATPPPALNRPPDLRVFQANVLYTRTDYRPIIDTIRQLKPDFFVLQEMTPDGYRAMSALKNEYPYQDSIWAKGPCFIVVGSRTPFTTDSTAEQSHEVLLLTSMVRGQPMSLLSVHTRTPLLPSWFAQRNRQLAFVASQLSRIERPAVLIGDFNTSIFSPVFKREFLDRQHTDLSIDACRTNFGWKPTWPTFLPLLYIPIDHAFVNTGYKTANFRTLSTPGSDHRAICVDLIYR